jgi:hypothetical protein
MFSMNGNGQVSSQIDTEVVREQLAGRSVNDATAYLVSQLPLQQGTTPSISISPDWFSSMPLLSMRITVQLQDNPA